MTKRLLLALAALGLAAQFAAAQHTIIAPNQLTWGPAPPVLPPGAHIAVLDGDPTKPGYFSMRLKFPDGYRVPPHWHPTDENIVVLQGVFRLGMGHKLAPETAHDIPAGGFARMPAEARHFALAKGETIIQIYGMGPFVVNYVNPADDPTRKTPGQ